MQKTEWGTLLGSYVTFTGAAATQNTAAFQVYNAPGRMVRSQAAPTAGTEAVLPLLGLPSGIYIIRCDPLSQRLTVE